MPMELSEMSFNISMMLVNPCDLDRVRKTFESNGLDHIAKIVDASDYVRPGKMIVCPSDRPVSIEIDFDYLKGD